MNIPPINAKSEVEAENSCNCSCPSSCCISRKVKHDKDCHQHKKVHDVAHPKIKGKK